MSADQLGRKARERQDRARRKAISSITLALILFAVFAWDSVRAGALAPRIGFAVLSLWSLYFGYQAYKWIWPRQLATDAPLDTTLQSYRSELEKRRDYLRHIWRWAGLTICFLGVAMVVAPELIRSLNDPRRLLNVAPILVLLSIWLAVFIHTRKRGQRKLQLEIEELRAFETRNR